MALLRIAFLSLLLSAAARAVELRFVPATSDGVVSLGIYDSSGRLVRLLCEEWPMEKFNAELNGLTTEWDGKDSQGRPVANGTYHARGFVVGNIGVDGEAFHFNDWITSGNSPRIVSVGAVSLLPGGDLLMAARLADDRGALLRYSPRASEPWQVLATEKISDAMGKTKLALSDGRAFVLAGDKIRALDISNGQETAVPPLVPSPSDISARDGRLLIVGDGKLRIFNAVDFAPLSEFSMPEAGAVSAALLGEDMAVAAGQDGSLWVGGKTWKPIDMPDGAKAKAVAAGRASTFWVLEQKNDQSSAVVQYSPEEGRLAEWNCSANADVASLAASADDDYFCAVLRGPTAERTVAIRRSPQGPWQFVADKTITACGSFGLIDGRLAPSSDDAPSALAINVSANPLDPNAPRSLQVRASQFIGGTGLVAEDGLPLVRVSEERGPVRVMAQSGAEPNTARFYQGDGACVEEYKLTHLGDITAFDAGTIEMEGGAEKPAPPEEEDPDPTP